MNRIGHFSRRNYYHNPAPSPYLYATLPEVFDATAKRLPSKHAVVVYQSRTQRDCWTFAELRKKSIALATALYQRGYKRGDRIAVFAPNCHEYFLIVLALSRIGCNGFLFSNLDTLANNMEQYACLALVMYVGTDKEKMVCEEIAKKTSDIVTFGPNSDGISGSSVHLCSLIEKEDALDHHNLPDAKNFTPDDPLFVFFTSGSTGKPKGVQYTHRFLLQFSSFNDMLEVKEDSICFNDRPLAWLGGINTLMVMAVYGVTGVTVNTAITVADGEVDFVMGILKRERCTHVLMMRYFMVDLLGRDDPSLHDVPSLQYILTGGQILDMNTTKDIMLLFPNVKCVVNGYGSTEVGSGALRFNTITTYSDTMKIVNGVEAKLIDENGLDIPPDTEGELCFRSPWILPKCYVDNEEASRKASDDAGWFHTSDIAMMNADGEIKICGRKDDMIKRATIKVFPAEVENVISEHPAVEQVVVVGVPDARLGEELCASVILNEEHTADSLQEWCKARFSVGPDGLSLAPKYFLTRSEFPKTLTGKTDRKLIKQLAINELKLKM
ncbi:acyl-CoA synthetase family member 2, mitochondrial-like [Lingula anatina]|uniref:Acyl-CoA synthetase family member 2, mitochondrial-like n=1 Tax=Lingula anatina TaxID=7574 RepID=A0A1S3KGT7_LINAN|nr:acyl-CoA synthetase family member 2, mitochondrial-like [Lingula anatina]|eukprot:XP_013421702.1 acyl-CoA synthetase family member 2, mitochondrial-like [Lingula anatina]